MATSDGFVPVPGVHAEPVVEHVVEDAAALIAVVNLPLRAEIVYALIEHPMTAAELAARLGVPPTRLYYHLDLLASHGVIHVVATRRVRGVEERRYRAVGRTFRPHPDLIARARQEPELLDEVLQAMFAGVRAELRGVADRIDLDAEHQMLLSRTVVRMAGDRRGEFLQRLEELMKEYDDEAGDERLGLLIAAYPLPAHPAGSGQPDDE